MNSVINKQMIAILVCPACKGSLEFDEPAARLNCVPCELSYLVINDIPVMVVDKAEPLAAAKR